MNAVQSQIGSQDVLFEAEYDVAVINRNGESQTIQLTSLGENIKDAYQGIKEVLTDFSQDIGEKFQSIAQGIRPNKAEIELSLGVSADSKLIIFNGKGNAGLKVKFTWEF